METACQVGRQIGIEQTETPRDPETGAVLAGMGVATFDLTIGSGTRYNPTEPLLRGTVVACPSWESMPTTPATRTNNTTLAIGQPHGHHR